MLPKQILQIDTQLKWKKMAFIFERALCEGGKRRTGISNNL